MYLASYIIEGSFGENQGKINFFMNFLKVVHANDRRVYLGRCN